MNIDRRSGIDLLEEAVDLLRRTPARAWAGYLLGAVPFWGGLLIFWSWTTGNLEVPNPLPGALMMALLFGLRQYGRAYFGHIMYQTLAGPLPVARGGFALAWFVGLMRIPMLVIPAPAVIAFFRNISILALRDDEASGILKRALSLAVKGGDQVAALLTMAAVTFVLWLNVFTGMVSLPVLFQIFTGQQTIVTRNIGALLNGTTMLASMIATWCIADVMLTAFYTLRVFYGESEDTGADLLRVWRGAVQKGTAVALLICCLPILHAAETKDLNAAIDQVLAEQPYQWRQPAPIPANQNAFVTWTDNVIKSFNSSITTIQREWERFKAWLRGREAPPPARNRNAPPPTFGLRVLSWLAILVLTGAVIALLLRSGLIRSNPGSVSPLPGARPMDLEDPAILASQLPEDEWVALARDFMARGDYRMALRAWFLANLAYLGSRELVDISRSKTNLDYLREVGRRGRRWNGLEGLFAGNVRSFESAWYGLHPVGGEEVNLFVANFEELRSLLFEAERIQRGIEGGHVHAAV